MGRAGQTDIDLRTGLNRITNSMTQLPAPPVLPAFVDRRTSFVLLGILAILLGGLCTLFILAMAFGQLAMARKTSVAPNWAAAAMPMGIYLVAAIVLITLGIGAIRTRRWARALTVCLAWMAMVIGAFALAFILWIMTQVKLPQPGEQPPRSMRPRQCQ